MTLHRFGNVNVLPPQTAALIVDTTASIIAFPVCGDVFGEDGTCIPYQDPQDSSFKCKSLPVRERFDVAGTVGVSVMVEVVHVVGSGGRLGGVYVCVCVCCVFARHPPLVNTGSRPSAPKRVSLCSVVHTYTPRV